MNSDLPLGPTLPEDDAGDRLALHPFGIRILAVLAEKEALTPDAYPMSANALTNGCNQLTSRDPVMTITEEQVQQTLQQLIQEKLVTEVHQASARVSKYQHRLRVKWSLEQEKLAVLTVLMLRGPQTAGEIRTRSGRMHEFISVAGVEIALQFLIDKYPPLVARLPRLLGTKEMRYATLLSGEVPAIVHDAGNTSSAMVPSGRQDRISQLEAEVTQLRKEVVALAAQFQKFKQQFE